MNANEELEMRRKLEIQMINKTLKPCPFCGGGAKYETRTKMKKDLYGLLSKAMSL